MSKQGLEDNQHQPKPVASKPGRCPDLAFGIFNLSCWCQMICNTVSSYSSNNQASVTLTGWFEWPCGPFREASWWQASHAPKVVQVGCFLLLLTTDLSWLYKPLKDNPSVIWIMNFEAFFYTESKCVHHRPKNIMRIDYSPLISLCSANSRNINKDFQHVSCVINPPFCWTLFW